MFLYFLSHIADYRPVFLYQLPRASYLRFEGPSYGPYTALSARLLCPRLRKMEVSGLHFGPLEIDNGGVSTAVLLARYVTLHESPLVIPGGSQVSLLQLNRSVVGGFLVFRALRRSLSRPSLRSPLKLCRPFATFRVCLRSRLWGASSRSPLLLPRLPPPRLLPARLLLPLPPPSPSIVKWSVISPFRTNISSSWSCRPPPA